RPRPEAGNAEERRRVARALGADDVGAQHGRAFGAPTKKALRDSKGLSVGPANGPILAWDEILGSYVPSNCGSDAANALTTSSSTPSSSRGPFSSPCSSSSPSSPSSLPPWLPPVGIENVPFRPSLRREATPHLNHHG